MTQFDDPRKELLEQLVQWLDWQRTCGADAWMVEDIAVWNSKLPRTPRQQHRPTSRPASSTGATDLSGFLQQRPTTPEVSAPVERPTRRSMTKLEGAWGQILESRTPTIDFSKLNEQTGLKVVKAHQQQHCQANRPCVIGGGRPANPILVVEGHAQGLTPSAKESLGKIMDHVLKIPRTKMYWLPYPIVGSGGQSDRCALCPHLFKASLECLAPQLVLVMGSALNGNLSLKGANGPALLGQEIEFQTNKWTIPGVWTHHPTDMVASTQLKKECLQHLEIFKRLMRRRRI